MTPSGFDRSVQRWQRSGFAERAFLSSDVVDWTSLLVEEVQYEPIVDGATVPATADLRIILVVGGEARIESHHRHGWRRATYRCGDLGVTVPGRPTRMRWRTSHGPLRALHLHVPFDRIASAADHVGRAAFVPDRLLDALPLTDPVVGAVVSAARRAAGNGMDRLYADAAADFVALHVVSSDYADERPRTYTSPGRLAKVVEFVHDNLDRSFGLAELAEVAGMSTFHFSRVFTAHTGRTPHQYVLAARLDASRGMLTSTNSLVSTVARSFGFGSGSHFAVAFRKRFGVSPSEYRGVHLNNAGFRQEVAQ